MRDYIMGFFQSNATPGQAGNVFWATVYILLIFAGVSVGVIAMNWLERKIMAHMQVRLGPMRVGPHGLLQPFADALKLLLKEDLVPAQADKFVYYAAPLVVVGVAFAVFTVVPFGPTAAVTDMNIGLLFMLGVSSLAVLGIVMAGWASNSHYPLMGALRSSAQMVSYEVAMGMAVLTAVLMSSLHGPGFYGVGGSEVSGTGTLSMIGLVQAQADQGIWFIFKFFPLGLISFVVFAIAMIAETNRAPFDLPEAESELTAGFHTEYSGFRWSFFFLAEYAAMMAVSSVAITLWLGGWLRPFESWHGPQVTIPHFWEQAAPQGGVIDFIFSFVPALSFLFLAGMCLRAAMRLAHPSFRIQKAGIAAFGLLLALVGVVFLIPPVRDAVQPVFWFVAKVAVFMYLYIWYRSTFPRYRFDQLMKVGWKVLLPIGIGALTATAFAGVWPEIWRLLRGN